MLSELQKRVIVAIIGIPLLCVVFYFGDLLFTIVFAFIETLALWEFYRMAEQKNIRPYKLFGYICGLVPFIYGIILQFNCECISMLSVIISILPITLALLLVGLCLMLFANRQNPLLSFGGTLGGLLYTSLSFYSIVLLRHNNHSTGIGEMSSGFWIVVLMFCTIWLCDSAAFFFGRKFGKHKLMPSVSPNKSVEGAVAGFIISAIFFPLAITYCVPSFSILPAVICGVLIGIIGQIGDLAESRFKRDANVKDSSNIIPGHGGVLDRFDSVMLAAPTIVIVLCIFGMMG